MKDASQATWSRRVRLGALAASLLLLAAGCGGGESEPAAPAIGGGMPRADVPAKPAAPGLSPAAAGEIFLTRCSSCHGAEGRGDGPASAGLTPKPRNFHDPAWQSSVTDSHIEQVISYGGAAGGLSPIMPAHPDLANRPEVLAALRQHLRSLRD